MLFLCYPKCSTCKKAKKWLAERHIEYTERNIAEDHPTYDELKAWYQKSGLPLKKFFNTSGLVYKEMQLKDKLPSMSEEDQLKLLATNGMLVKRPIAISEDRVLVGFKEAEWEVYCDLDHQSGEKEILDRFEFRNVEQSETERAIAIEQICFPPNEACSAESMTDRIAAAGEFFLVAVDKENGEIAGFLNGIATDEDRFRDEFFTDISLHEENGEKIMLLGLDVLPEYRRIGLGRALVSEYLRREQEKGRKEVVLTCLQEKVEMYQKFGFADHGIANSTWGGEKWHEMSCILGS